MIIILSGGTQFVLFLNVTVILFTSYIFAIRGGSICNENNPVYPQVLYLDTL